MAVRLLFFCVVLMPVFALGLIVCVHSCVQRNMPPPGSVEVSSLWHRYFGGRRLKSLGTPAIYDTLYCPVGKFVSDFKAAHVNASTTIAKHCT